MRTIRQIIIFSIILGDHLHAVILTTPYQSFTAWLVEELAAATKPANTPKHHPQCSLVCIVIIFLFL